MSPSVAAVVPTKDPDRDHLDDTLASLDAQSHPIAEIHVVDSSDQPIDLASATVHHEPALGIGAARSYGAKQAGADVVLHADEDAVLHPEYVERGVGHLAKPSVSAAGGPVEPIDDKLSGRVLGALDDLNPSHLGTHYLMHAADDCPDGGCISKPGRGEDLELREHLQQRGRIVRDPDMVALKDLPTARQQAGMKALGIAGGAVACSQLAAPTLEKLPKGSRCVDKKDVPARSDYWRSDTDTVSRCAGFDTDGTGRGSGTDDGGADGDVFDAYPDRRIMRQTVYEVFDALLRPQTIDDLRDKYDDCRTLAGETLSRLRTKTNLDGRELKQLFGDVTADDDELTVAHAQQRNDLGPFGPDVEPADSPRSVNGWGREREEYDKIDYTAEWYEGLPTGELTDTEPHEIEEAMVTVTSASSSKYPKRWVARLVLWSEDGRNVYDSQIDAWWTNDTNVENRNAALSDATDWMEAHDTAEPPDEPEDDESEEESEGHGAFPAFSLSIDNGRLREVTEPFYRFDGHQKYDAHFTVSEGSIEFVGVNSDNTVMYTTVLDLDAAESATVDDTGRTVKFPPEALANAVNDVNMSEPASLRVDGNELVYEGAGKTSTFTLDDTSVGMPDLPDLDKDGPRVENVPAKKFKQRVRALSKIYDESGYGFPVAFVTAPNEAYMVTENDDGERARARLTDDASDTYTPHDDTYPTLFSTGYFRDVSLSPYAPSSTEITFRQYSMADTDASRFYDSPMRILYDQRGGSVEFLVAPNVSDDNAWDLSDDEEAGSADWDLTPPEEPVEYDGTCPADGEDWALAEPIEPGEPVPDRVKANLDVDGDTIVWFFPNSDGCRCGTQAQQFSTLSEEMGTTVYGVSKSPKRELESMGEKLSLSSDMTLISDRDGDLADAFGVDETDAGFERKTFFIRDGTVRDVSDGVMASALEQPIHPDETNERPEGCLPSLSAAADDTAPTCPGEYPDLPTVDLEPAADRWDLEAAQSGDVDLADSLTHPGIYVITGQRGAGKSALAMQAAETIKDEYGTQPVTVGMPVQAREEFPEDWKHVRYVHDAPGDSVLVVDEAYMNYHSRESMSEENKNLGKLINTSRHCGNTMLFVSQNSSYIEKNTVSEADALLAKEPGKMQMQFERMQVRSISQAAKEKFDELGEDVDNRAYVYVYGDDHEGMIQNDLPDWYNESISKSFKALCDKPENGNENERADDDEPAQRQKPADD